MSAQGWGITTPLLVLALGLGLVLHYAGQRPRENRGEPASPLVPRQAARAVRPAPAGASRSELTDMIDASDGECDAAECARLLASAF